MLLTRYTANLPLLAVDCVIMIQIANFERVFIVKVNQFSLIQTDDATRRHELKALHLLMDGDENLSASQLLLALLLRTHLETTSDAGRAAWLKSLLATPTTNAYDWFKEDEQPTDAVFYLLALQLLDFEVAVDFPLEYPLLGIKRSNLPHHYHEEWDQAAVIDSFYLLLLTRTKNGISLLDKLTSQGMLTWTYHLPASQKPIFFNGKPVASFNPHRFIHEVVYVQTDLDTDFDGEADLVKAEVIRPADSNQGLKVPVLFTASPYNQGTNDEWGEKITHDVNVPLTHKDPDADSPAEATFPTPAQHRDIQGVGPASERFAATPSYTLNDYLATRGYAVVYSAGIGTKDSDGLQTCGSPEQTEAMKAVVEWLHGDRVAFSDRTSNQSVVADWSNGHVAMTGRSYLGTLATAVATTGVAGLDAIISEAAISSWYDYYREGGLVVAPGGFQGEDADVLAAETFSRTKSAADYQHIEGTNQKYLQQMTAAQDRASGNYNDFWARRNYHPHFSGIKAAVMIVHGLNDTNVKPVHVKALDDYLKAADHPAHLILHQGQHIYINAFASLDFSEMVNLWLADKLWGVKNDADQVLPRVLFEDNRQEDNWQVAQAWDGRMNFTYHVADHQLVKGAATSASPITFNDHQADATYQDWCAHPAKWQTALLNDDGQFSAHFATEVMAGDLVLRGTPQLTVDVATNLDHGLLSAYLVDRGTARRLTKNPVLLGKNAIPLGYQWKYDDLREFKLEKEPSDYHVISYGHLNLQNRHSLAKPDDYQPNQTVTLTLPLQPVYHHLEDGHQLELILFATDYLMTVRGNEKATYTIDPATVELRLPADFA